MGAIIAEASQTGAFVVAVVAACAAVASAAFAYCQFRHAKKQALAAKESAAEAAKSADDANTYRRETAIAQRRVADATERLADSSAGTACLAVERAPLFEAFAITLVGPTQHIGPILIQNVGTVPVTVREHARVLRANIPVTVKAHSYRLRPLGTAEPQQSLHDCDGDLHLSPAQEAFLHFAIEFGDEHEGANFDCLTVEVPCDPLLEGKNAWFTIDVKAKIIPAPHPPKSKGVKVVGHVRRFQK